MLRLRGKEKEKLIIQITQRGQENLDVDQYSTLDAKTERKEKEKLIIQITQRGRDIPDIMVTCLPHLSMEAVADCSSCCSL